jgi:hypothetical protein
MKYSRFLLFPFALMPSCCKSYDSSKFSEGDIIFQTSTSSQSQAIELATHSRYSHMGIISKQGDDLFVYEAVQPTKMTPLSRWIARGVGHHFVLRRLKYSQRILTSGSLEDLRAVEKLYLGKNYDIYFQWSNERMYCSELVWKVYKKALNIELAGLQCGSDFDFSNPIVEKKVRERFPNGFPPNEVVISPQKIFDSRLLETVYEQ